MNEPKIAKNSELQDMAKKQPHDSKEELMAMLIFRKTHLKEFLK
ncbi:hypothetical protein [Fructobacillus tropaeoli]|uniref:Uncharacterized protein n=1 Tax=Fructobacillus tropaeoli TaxID=709323 RepID=A0A3F3HHJ7_9LACO|nr:hypothetical protein [Fructobacillus tropaeoli]GAP05009.1 hypothetical protein FTRO_0200020 [Fructobacillus tropaeoli]